jgi:hypothetical protein
MSDISKSLDKLFSFITSANMGFVLFFLLAIYPIYMWGVITKDNSVSDSIAYNTSLLTSAGGRFNLDNIVVGNEYCVGRECANYLSDHVIRQIAEDARSSIPLHAISTVIGTFFVFVSAVLWALMLFTIKTHKVFILTFAIIITTPAAISIAGPDKNTRFCSDPIVEASIYNRYSGITTNTLLPVCIKL